MKEIRVGEGNEAVKSPPLTFFMLLLYIWSEGHCHFQVVEKNAFFFALFSFCRIFVPKTEAACLASDHFSSIGGQVIQVDGGMNM